MTRPCPDLDLDLDLDLEWDLEWDLELDNNKKLTKRLITRVITRRARKLTRGRKNLCLKIESYIESRFTILDHFSP